MQYFSKETLSFFEELAGNNQREWFHANKKRYETHVKEPFKLLVAKLIELITDEDPRVRGIEVKNTLFRINRDIRFSKDKSPYKTWMAAVISPGGRKKMFYPGIYIQIGRDGLKIAGGCFRPDKAQLYALRSHIAKHHRKFKKLITDENFVELFGSIRGDTHKRIPKEFKELHEKVPLIANKQFYYIAENDPKEILREDVSDFIMNHYMTQEGLMDFFRKALKDYL